MRGGWRGFCANLVELHTKLVIEDPVHQVVLLFSLIRNALPGLIQAFAGDKRPGH